MRLWLQAIPRRDAPDAAVADRTRELIALGFKSFDALHLASAELLNAAVLCTCDDRLLSTARRLGASLKVRVANPIDRSGDFSMTTVLINPVELRRQGFEALVKGLGWVNAVRFLQQYETSRLDYTSERDQLLPEWDADTLLEKLREKTVQA